MADHLGVGEGDRGLPPLPCDSCGGGGVVTGACEEELPCTACGGTGLTPEDFSGTVPPAIDPATRRLACASLKFHVAEMNRNVARMAVKASQGAHIDDLIVSARREISALEAVIRLLQSHE